MQWQSGRLGEWLATIGIEHPFAGFFVGALLTVAIVLLNFWVAPLRSREPISFGSNRREKPPG